MRKKIITLLSDENGATAMEYGLLGALIAAAIVTGAMALGTQLSVVFDSVTQDIQAASS